MTERDATRDNVDSLMTALDPPMVVVTVADAHERAGCLVGFHSQSGLEPAKVAVWLSKANHTFRVAVFAEIIAVHFLTANDVELAAHFGASSSDVSDKFARCTWRPGPSGVPLLDRCPNRIIGRKDALLDARSDHVCVLLDPIESTYIDGFAPLRLSQVSHIDPGHVAAERPTPVTTLS